MTAVIDITEEHRGLVIDLLRAHLPPGVAVWVFGSRATGAARRYSDLDLAIDAGRPLSLDETGAMAEAFSDSDLPYRVDIVDWCLVEDDFRRLITADRLPLIDKTDRSAEVQDKVEHSG
jgi:predicted nucleotidyltransferase